MTQRLVYGLFTLILAGSVSAGQNQQAPAPRPKASIEGVVTKAGTSQPLRGVRVSLRKDSGTQNLPDGMASFAYSDVVTTLRVASVSGVNVLGGGAMASVTTDASGRFAIAGVDPGQYRISADRDGYVHYEYGQRTLSGNGTPLVVRDGQQLAVSFGMTAAAVISGRATDESGEPVLMGTVVAYAYQYSEGRRLFAQVGQAQTDDRGEYRVFGLPPGEYFLGIRPPGGVDEQSRIDLGALPSALPIDAVRGIARNAVRIVTDAGGGGAQSYKVLQLGGAEPAPLYYPGTADPEGAAPVRVAAAAEVRGIDFSLRPVRTVSVRGRVIAPPPTAAAPAPRALALGAAGGVAHQDEALFSLGYMAGVAAAQSIQVMARRIGSPAAPAGLLLNGTPVSADGTFEIRGLTPGSYDLIAVGRQPQQPMAAKIRIDVGSEDLNGVTINVRPAASIRGTVNLETPPVSGFAMNRLRVTLATVDNLPVGSITVPVADDGTFTVSGVLPVDYRVRVAGFSGGGYLQSGTLGSTDALNGPFTPNTDQDIPLQLQIGFTSSRVSGTVVEATGKPVSGAQAVLVPNEPLRGRTDWYFSTSTDPAGAYNFTNVPPGGYRLFAWEEVPPGAYQYPEYLRRYEDRGVPIRVERNGSAGGEVKLIPAGN